MIHNYWSCSKFSKWIRTIFCKDVIKPRAGTSKEWKDWTLAMKNSHPFVYWLTEDFLNDVQDFLYWPMKQCRNVQAYIQNRFVDKTHYLRTGFAPGGYYGADERILNALLNVLVDFIEIELANKYCACYSKAAKQYNRPWHNVWTQWRCPEAGLAMLDIERNFIFNEEVGIYPEDAEYGKLMPQAIAAQEIHSLYHWWKNVRPIRPDSMDASGWSAYCDKYEGDFLALLNSDNEESTKAHKTLMEMNEQYEAEDERAMIALIKVRQYLWT